MQDETDAEERLVEVDVKGTALQATERQRLLASHQKLETGVEGSFPTSLKKDVALTFS